VLRAGEVGSVAPCGDMSVPSSQAANSVPSASISSRSFSRARKPLMALVTAMAAYAWDAENCAWPFGVHLARCLCRRISSSAGTSAPATKPASACSTSMKCTLSLPCLRGISVDKMMRCARFSMCGWPFTPSGGGTVVIKVVSCLTSMYEVP